MNRCSLIKFYDFLTVYFDILCNEYQLYGQRIFNLFLQSTSTCFGHVYCPSSGGIHCICTKIATCYTFKLTGCWPGQDGTGSIHVEADWGNKLKISSASGWFSLKRIQIIISLIHWIISSSGMLFNLSCICHEPRYCLTFKRRSADRFI
jgi:hypothetical protein